MPAIVHATCEFMTTTHLPKDVVQNSFVFATDAGDITAAAEQAAAQVQAFYNLGTTPVSTYLGNVIDRTFPAVVKCYALSTTSSSVPDVHGAGTGFGSPVAITPFTLGTSGAGTDYPAQVAAVLSYHSAQGLFSEHSGPGPRLAERTRGRIYLGPLTTGTGSTDTAEQTPVLSTTFVSAVVAAGTALLVPPTALPDLTWRIWSRKDNLCRLVTGGFMDDRFDTQRRRLEAATRRSGFGGT